MDINTLIQLATPILLAIWLFWTERQKGKDKEGVISSAYTREQKRSNQMFDEASEKTALSQVLTSFSDLVKHTIDSNNGHLSELTTKVITGFKDADTLATGDTKDVMNRLERIEASLNQIVIFLQGRAGQPIAGGDVSEIGAASIRTKAIERSAAIVEAADKQAEKDTAHPESAGNVIAIVKAEPNDKT